MRVLSIFGVAPSRIGGAEMFVRELSIQLQQRGGESVVCFLSEPPEEVKKFLSLPNVTLDVLANSTSANRKSAMDLGRLLRRYRPDILHLHFTGFLGVYPWVAKLLGVKKIFFTDQTSRPAGYVPQRAPLWKRSLVRLINLPITKVTCVSNYGYRCMTTLGVLPNDRYVMIYNAIDFSRVHPNPERGKAFRQRYGIPENRTVIVQVSWIIPEKGFPELLKAAQLVVAKNRNVHFVFVGEGAYREQYTRDAEALGISDHITWTGLLKDPFEEGVYDVADIQCQASNWEEVFGWVIAEAMAYGKPVVGTRVGGIPELVEDSVSGYLAERANEVSIAEKILALAADPQLTRQMGAEAQRRAREKFDLREKVEQLVRYYDI